MFCNRLFFVIPFLVFSFFSLQICVGQPATTLANAPGARSPAAEAVREKKPERFYDLRYTNRNFYLPGEYKVVTVPVIEPRQGMIDAQTYHIGWVAVEARMGQSRVMYNVLLEKLPPYVPGTPPVTRPIKKDNL